MSTAVALNHIGKMYKLYHHPRDKVFDALGINRWLFWRKNYYEEFWALRDITLEVKKGERLGIIGRNGSGKSTMLKIIAGTSMPTEGEVSMNGRVQALMELGIGFHPDFTGRQNIWSSLAYQGLKRSDIARKEEEIINFAELGEFIDQPVKNFSSGMYARLAFAVATSVEPELLIIDEVLGAGDAYFIAKSLDRMKRLTEQSGATVLFVSHDLGSVQQICTRTIWLDRGAVIMDGEPLEVSKKYYAHILTLEEQRLSLLSSRVMDRRGTQIAVADNHLITFRLCTQTGEAPHLSHPVRSINLTNSDGYRLSVDVGGAMDNDRSQPIYLLADSKYMNWSQPRLFATSYVRFFEDVEGVYRHAPFVINVPPEFLERQPVTLQVEHAAQAGEVIQLEILKNDQYQPLGQLSQTDGSWMQDQFSLDTGMVANAPEVMLASDDTAEGNDQREQGSDQPSYSSIKITASSDDRWETNVARFVDIYSVDSGGRKKFIFGKGEKIGFKIATQVKIVLESCWLVMVIYDLKGNPIIVWRHQFKEKIQPGEYTWWLWDDHPVIRQDEYVVSFELIPYFDAMAMDKLPFYCHWDRGIKFRIDEGYMGHVPLGTIESGFTFDGHPQ